MEDRPTPTSLAASVGISMPYASQLLSGARQPARPLALRIFSITGLKLGALTALKDEDVATLLRIEATPRTGEQAAA